MGLIFYLADILILVIKNNAPMSYTETLGGRIRHKFSVLENVEEKEMMGGLTFMYNDKMCVGIFRGELMCRIDPAVYESALEKRGCKSMEFAGKVMSTKVLATPSPRTTVELTGVKSEPALAAEASFPWRSRVRLRRMK